MDVLPSSDPFHEQLQRLTESLRMSPGDWTYLAGAAVYTAIMAVLGYLLILYSLRRRSMT